MTPRQLADLIHAHAGPLTLYARQWAASPDDAVQAAFCKLAAVRVPPTDAVAWLYRVARNAAIDAGKADRRRAAREAAVARPDAWFAESRSGELDAAAAVAALEELPGDQREIIVARLWGKLTLDQAAAAAGCSISTAHRRYEAGLKALRERLGVACPKTT